MSDFEKGKYGEKRVESEEWSDDIIWPGESIEWSIDILKKCPLWTFPPLFIARFVPQKWPSLETMNDYIDNPRPCLLTEREKEGVRYEELEWWYDFLLFREEPDDFSTYWDDPFGYIVGITECIRKDYSDDELLRFQQEVSRLQPPRTLLTLMQVVDREEIRLFLYGDRLRECA